MSDTPTPRTDAAEAYRGLYARKINGEWDRSQCGELTELGEERSLVEGYEWAEVSVLPSEFARTLERELAAKDAEIAELRKRPAPETTILLIQAVEKQCEETARVTAERDSLVKKIAALTKERDEARAQRERAYIETSDTRESAEVAKDERDAAIATLRARLESKTGVWVPQTELQKVASERDRLTARLATAAMEYEHLAIALRQSDVTLSRLRAENEGLRTSLHHIAHYPNITATSMRDCALSTLNQKAEVRHCICLEEETYSHSPGCPMNPLNL